MPRYGVSVSVSVGENVDVDYAPWLHSRDVCDDQWDEEEADELRAEDGDRELHRQAEGSHPKETGERPKEESPCVRVVRAKVDVKRQGDHGVEEGHGEVQ